ncbi:MAG: YegP family protein [Eubacteriales bacterium]|nr:YegP family protein [Eubacteriales bacterium]
MMMGKYVIKQGKSGPYFVLKAANGEPIGTSEAYSSETACKNGIESVRKNAPVAGIEDQTVDGWKNLPNPVFELYKDKGGEFRFRLRAKNGEPILASEGYSAKASCIGGIESVKKNADSDTIAE